MFTYLIRRIFLLPITLFVIILINFVIINLAPGDPTTVTERSSEGAIKDADRSVAFGSDERYLLFREQFGLTLPLLINTWPYTSYDTVERDLFRLVNRKKEDIPFKEFTQEKTRFGDRAPFVMPKLLQIIQNEKHSEKMQEWAIAFFIRGGKKFAHIAPSLTPKQREENREIAKSNQMLEQIKTAKDAEKWYATYYHAPTPFKKFTLIFHTRLTKYLGKVLTLDFGTLRNDPNRRVIDEVAKRFKYSLTLSVIPLIITFFLSIVFGFVMAYTHNRLPDTLLNVLFLSLYATPIFVVAPLLIEKVALNSDFFPLGGFTSPEQTYSLMTTDQRLKDILRHLILPVTAIMYGSLATSSRLARVAVLEVKQADYVRYAHARGISPWQVMTKHVGRNAAITITTAIAGSLGAVLGGSLIVETLFEIDGFGKFFYDAVINRDYNVIMFSALAGSFLSLVGYLVADIAYTLLDPRVNLNQ